MNYNSDQTIYTTEQLHDMVVSCKNKYCERLQEQILASTLPLIKKTAKQYAHTNDVDDYTTLGLLEVVTAIDKWDANGGAKFVSFAMQRVRWAFSRERERNQIFKNHTEIDDSDTYLVNRIYTQKKTHLVNDAQRDFLTKLKPLEKDVLILTQIHNYTYKEAANILGVDLKKVVSAQAMMSDRAFRKKLRKRRR